MTSSSKELWFLTNTRLPYQGGGGWGAEGGNEVGAQVFLVASEDIAAGI